VESTERATEQAGERIVRALERAGYRVTAPRRLVAELAASSHGHFTAADLMERGQRGRRGIGRATVFRTLDLLESLRIVGRIEMPDGAHAYVLCDPDEHHHHLVCLSCGRGVEVADGELLRLVAEIGQRHGYRVQSHRLELFGTCPDCAAKEGQS
jgi:Fur family ferric uptake transcriptional regulator